MLAMRYAVRKTSFNHDIPCSKNVTHSLTLPSICQKCCPTWWNLFENFWPWIPYNTVKTNSNKDVNLLCRRAELEVCLFDKKPTASFLRSSLLPRASFCKACTVGGTKCYWMRQMNDKLRDDLVVKYNNNKNKYRLSNMFPVWRILTFLSNTPH